MLNQKLIRSFQGYRQNFLKPCATKVDNSRWLYFGIGFLQQLDKCPIFFSKVTPPFCQAIHSSHCQYALQFSSDLGFRQFFTLPQHDNATARQRDALAQFSDNSTSVNLVALKGQYHEIFYHLFMILTHLGPLIHLLKYFRLWY